MSEARNTRMAFTVVLAQPAGFTPARDSVDLGVEFEESALGALVEEGFMAALGFTVVASTAAEPCAAGD